MTDGICTISGQENKRLPVCFEGTPPLTGPRIHGKAGKYTAAPDRNLVYFNILKHIAFCDIMEVQRWTI